MEYFSVIDIGTNAYKISIEDEKGVNQYNQNMPSRRLGQSVDVDGEYLISCLDEYNQELKEYNLSLVSDNVKIVATENFRRVRNSEEVLESIKDTRGVSIDIITKDEEAELGIKGALSKLKGMDSKNVIYIDLGGGSTEVSFYSGSSKKVEASTSIPVGSRLLLEDLNTAKEQHGVAYEKLIYSNIKKDIRTSIEGFKKDFDFEKYKNDLLVLTNAGPILRIVSKDMGLDRYEPQLVQGNAMLLENISSELEKVSQMKPQEVINGGYSGYKAAPQTITGAYITKEVLNELELKNEQPIQASIVGVKEGLIEEMRKNKQKDKVATLSIGKQQDCPSL